MVLRMYDPSLSDERTIIERATGIDFDSLQLGQVAFDCDRLLNWVGLSTFEIEALLKSRGVGGTPLLELTGLTKLVRRVAGRGRGAHLFLKDEACNPSGSCKDRSAVVAADYARRHGYRGVVACSSGNHGVALAAQQAPFGLKAIIVQDASPDGGSPHPVALEKQRKAEALGAEVVRVSGGAAKWSAALSLLLETEYCYASLTMPWAIRGMETLGLEIAQQVRERCGRDPSCVVVTLAGGGQATGTARGLSLAGAYDTTVIGVGAGIQGKGARAHAPIQRPLFRPGLDMAYVPSLESPGVGDVPYSASRPLRHMDQLMGVTQGEVLYVTEALAQLDGLERGPNGNIALAAAFAVAQELSEDDILVVSESEYSGKLDSTAALLDYAQRSGMRVVRAAPDAHDPWHDIFVPESPDQVVARRFDLESVRQAYLRQAVDPAKRGLLTAVDYEFLALETNTNTDWVRRTLWGWR